MEYKREEYRDAKGEPVKLIGCLASPEQPNRCDGSSIYGVCPHFKGRDIFGLVNCGLRELSTAPQFYCTGPKIVLREEVSEAA